MERKGISKVVAVLIIIVITVAVSLILHLWITSISTQLQQHETPSSLKKAIKWEATKKLPSGGLRLYFRNVGEESIKIDHVYLKDPYSGLTYLTLSYKLELGPGEVGYINIPALYLARLSLKNINRVKVVLATSSGVGSTYGGAGKLVEILYKPTFLALKAYRYGNTLTHWVIFDYNTGKYKFYDDTNGNLQGPINGSAPILEDTNEYTITTSRVSWNKRPIDSPIVIVVNPKWGEKDWIFTWHDPHNTWKFFLQKLDGDIEVDFLIFWEDIYNPFHPRSLDDWKDHVVRVTVFTNGTYRIAVYMAKGGYKHEFYLNVNDNINLGTPVYVKPFGAFWANNVGEYYREMPGKIYLVTP